MGLIGGGFSSEIKRWPLIQPMDVVPTAGASQKFALPLTSFLFTCVLSAALSTVRNVATVPVQTVAH